jgi:hypothetical protein
MEGSVTAAWLRARRPAVVSRSTRRPTRAAGRRTGRSAHQGRQAGAWEAAGGALGTARAGRDVREHVRSLRAAG